MGQADADAPLAGHVLAMIFEKSSTRTRVSFDMAMRQLGGSALVLDGASSQLGRGETIADTARVLSRYVDAIMIRTDDHAKVEELAKFASVPVINGLTDLAHPCQLLADLQTVVQRFGADDVGHTLRSAKYAWIGDGNNMANSWINAAYRLGFELALACPEGYDPDPAILARGLAAGNVTLLRDPNEAAEGAHVVNTDVWASMGQEQEQEEREKAFARFTVTGAVMKRATSSSFVMAVRSGRARLIASTAAAGPALCLDAIINMSASSCAASPQTSAGRTGLPSSSNCSSSSSACSSVCRHRTGMRNARPMRKPRASPKASRPTCAPKRGATNTRSTITVTSCPMPSGRLTHSPATRR